MISDGLLLKWSSMMRLRKKRLPKCLILCQIYSPCMRMHFFQSNDSQDFKKFQAKRERDRPTSSDRRTYRQKNLIGQADRQKGEGGKCNTTESSRAWRFLTLTVILYFDSLSDISITSTSSSNISQTSICFFSLIC